MIIKPKKLQIGDSIGIIAPARKMNPTILEPSCQLIKKMGYNPVVQSQNLTHHPYLAGSDTERAAEFTRLWMRDDIKAIWAFYGGYGSSRLLSLLDFKALSHHPKIFIGMSDITALHLAFLKYNMVSFLGPCLASYHQQLQPWLSTIMGQALHLPLETSEILRQGQGEGRLVGGNLTMITSSLSTPWEIETADTILLIEEVGEEPYRIDRMLCQLKYAGKLEKLAGAILCSFARCEPENPQKAIQLHEVHDQYFAQAPYPVILNFPSGHIQEQATLPLGCRAQIDTAKQCFSLLETATSD